MNGLEGTSKASKEIMTLHIRAIMVLKTLMTVIIFKFKEDGQSILLVRFELKMPEYHRLHRSQIEITRVVLDLIRK